MSQFYKKDDINKKIVTIIDEQDTFYQLSDGQMIKKDIFNKNLETKDSIIFEYFIEKLEEDCLLKCFDSKSGRVVYSKDKLENYDKTLKKTNEEVNQFFKDIMLVTKTWEESYCDSHILVGTQWNIKLDFMGLEDNLINS